MAAGKIVQIKTTQSTTNSKKTKKSKKDTKVKTLEKIIDKKIDSRLESKILYHNPSESILVNFNSVINSTGDYLQLVPNCSPGDEENQRDGDEITVKNFFVKGYIRFNPILTGNIANVGVCQVGVRMMILSLKKASSQDLVQSSSTPLNSLLRRGATTVGFSGQISDLHNEINTDLFTVHHNKVFYMSQSYNNYATQVGYWETDIQNQIKFFSFKMKCKNKVLQYDDDSNGGLTPTNYCPFMLIGYCYLNNQVADVVATNLGLNYQTYLYYKDA